MATGTEGRIDPTQVRYCYGVQAWIEPQHPTLADCGTVAKCGHRNPSPICHSCRHAGESHSDRCTDCH